MNVFELFAKISLDTTDYENQLDEAKKRILSFGNELEETKKKTSSFGNNIEKAETKTSSFGNNLENAETKTSTFGNSIEDAGKKTSSFGDRLKSGFATAAKIGLTAIGAATSAAIAFAKSSVDTGMQFDSSMSQVAATMGTTVDKITELRDFAMDMGANTAFSATQAADALNYMALAGYNSEQAMEALPNVLNLAAAGGIGLASASDMVTDAQSALGLSMEESAELVDKMAMASSKSNTSVAQLGDAILTIGGTAKNLAGGTTELATALGILADNGIKGAEGGTALRNIILSLSAPTDTAAMAMESLGLQVYDAEGNMRPLSETFNDLNTSLSTMTQGEQTEVLSTIFNKVDLKSVNALLANTGERFDELSGYIDDATGAAEAMANTQLDNLAGDVTLFQSALEGAKIVLSDRLTPTLRGFVQFGSDAISTLSTAFSEGGLSGAMDALSTVLTEGLNMVIEQLPKFIDAGVQILGALAKGIIDALPNLLDAAVQIIIKLTEMILEPSMIAKLIETALKIIITLTEGIINAIPKLIDAAINIIENFIDYILDPQNIGKLLSMAVELVVQIAGGIISAIPKLLSAVAELISHIIDSFKDIDWTELGKNVIDGILNGFKSAWKKLTSWFSDAWDGLTGGVRKLLGIHSPSKVYAEIGKNMALGVGVGWEDGFDGVETGIMEDMDFDDDPAFDFTQPRKGGAGGRAVNVTQNIYAQKMTPSELMREAVYNQKKAVLFGV